MLIIFSSFTQFFVFISCVVFTCHSVFLSSCVVGEIDVGTTNLVDYIYSVISVFVMIIPSPACSYLVSYVSFFFYIFSVSWWSLIGSEEMMMEKQMLERRIWRIIFIPSSPSPACSHLVSYFSFYIFFVSWWFLIGSDEMMMEK